MNDRGSDYRQDFQGDGPAPKEDFQYPKRKTTEISLKVKITEEFAPV